MSKLQELQESFANVNVLFVEDEDELRKITFDFLKRIFTHVDTAENGEEGIALFKEKEYKLVISDLKMPRMDGREMLKQIHELNKDTVLIVTTATDSDIDATLTVCDAYMNKPIQFMEFIEILETLKNKILKS